MKSRKRQLLLSLIFQLSFLGGIKAQCLSGNCDKGYGIYVFKDSSRFEGNWKNGKFSGKGKYIYSNGDIYDGEWLDNKKSGLGKLTYHNGSCFEGNYKNGETDGEGKFIDIHGTIQEGKFFNGLLNGLGTVTYKNGDKYTGTYVNDKMNGNGKVYYISGNRFEGLFKDDQRNGQGTLYYAKGGTLKGIWLNDVFVSGSNKTVNSSTTTIQDSGAISIIKSKSGVYETSVLINGVLKLDLIFDTGASEVFLTPDIVLTLYRTKTITKADILVGGSYVDANGNIDTSVRFNIRELNIGGKVINNVAAGVGNSIDGMNLLGLSAIEKLGKLEIDFSKAEITTKKLP